MSEVSISKKPLVPTLQASELRDLRVLFLHPNASTCDEFEARFDEKSSRVNFYAASTLSAGRDILKRYGCQLAIFPDGLEGKDFVFSQLELKNALPSVRMIPLISVTSIEQLSAQRKIGGIHTFGQKSDADSFDAILSMVLNFGRDLSKNHPGLEEHLGYAKTLQGFLFAREPELLINKQMSSRILDGLLLKFDWSPQESLRIITAEMLYSPDLSAASYASLLGEDKYQLSPLLSQSASWKIAGSRPTGAGGFAITLSNSVAWQAVQSASIEEIIEGVFKRPHFLMHPSIRVIQKYELESLLESTFSGSKESRLKVNHAN